MRQANQLDQSPRTTTPSPRRADRDGVARQVPTPRLRALVAGDVPALVAAMSATLPDAGYEASSALDFIEVVTRATARLRRSPHPPLDLIVFVLSPEGWTYSSLIELLVREVGSLPMLVFTDGAAPFASRLEAVGVPVVARLPFASDGELAPRRASSVGAA